jgi:hypothetical protein
LFTGEVWGARDGQLDIILLTRGAGISRRIERWQITRPWINKGI